MNKLNQLIWIGLLLIWSSCNRYIDQQPTPDSGPPPASVQALTQQYPQSQDIIFTTIDNNQLWQADFVQQNQRYQALLSPTRLLTADQVVSNGVPDSLARLLESTVVAGGTFSNVRMRQYTWFSNPASSAVTHIYADYTRQQQPYTASWTITRMYSGKVTYYLELLPFQLTGYETDTPAEIPESLQAALRGQNLPFSYAWIQVNALRQRYGMVSLQNQGQPLYFTYDENGQLIAVNNPQMAKPLQRLDQLPASIQQYTQRPELAGFGLTGTDASLTHHTYGSMSTYRVNLQKDNQAWLMTFSDAGQLISRSFLIYGNF